MKLKELAEIKIGIKVYESQLTNIKKPLGTYLQYLRPQDFDGKSGYYILEKDLRKNKNYSPKMLLHYGDYLIFHIPDGKFKIMRYDTISGHTIPSDEIAVINTDFNIVKEFFGYEKNRKYFCNELSQRISNKDSLPTIEEIGSIEIMTDNIRELEEANTAEQIGMRAPLDITQTPFNILQKPLPFDKLLKRIKHRELVLDTEFQRRPGLWDIGVKSRLIESMIIRLPIPAFYFDGNNDDEWLVIDGLQRLSAVNSFVNEEFSLTGVDYLPSIEGKTYSQLERSQQRNIEEYEIFAYILQKGTPKNVTYRIFKNINTSALKLEPQEIRHALNPGIPATFLKKIAELDWFKKTVQISDRRRDRMEDRETVLRFMAFQRTSYTLYQPTIVDFLDNAMTDIYDIPNHSREMYCDELKEIIECISFIWEEYPFSRARFTIDKRSFSHNNILFELLTYGFSKISKEHRIQLKKNNAKFKKGMDEYFITRPDHYWEYDFAYSQENLKTRFKEIENIIKMNIS